VRWSRTDEVNFSEIELQVTKKAKKQSEMAMDKETYLGEQVHNFFG
jgi:hypothetical protein